MNDVDHYYLPRHDQDKLVEILGSIPSLVEDLSISLTRQDRITTGGPRIRHGHDEQPLPIGLAAMEAADELHDELVRWVREVCDQRVYPYPGNDTLTLARWLRRNIIALGLTEGADRALISIQRAVRTARRAVDCPTERPRPAPDAQKLAEADRMILGVRGIATLAKEMGGKFQGLTVRRVRYLANEAKLIEPVQVAGSERLYRVGDVRRAHIELLEAQQQQDIA